MKTLKHLFTMLLVLCSLITAVAQKRNRMVMVRNHLVLIIDIRSTKAEIDSLLQLSGITGQTADMLLRGNYTPAIKNGWKVKLKKNILNLDRSLVNDNVQVTPYLLSSTVFKSSNLKPGYPGEVTYGVNNFSRVTVHELPSGLTRFFVPGNLQAKRVLLSGNFNSWSTIKGLMNKTDSGWVIDIRLEPGKYAYKFIINSNWTTDENNSISEDDGAGNTNSIYYRYNYTFRLIGYPSARRISVGGSFNKWNTGEIAVHLKNGVWEGQLYLHDGIYLYRFMVNGAWITDPLNKLTQLQNNIPSSVLLFGETVTFKLNGYTSAHKVYVAGGFNNWDPDMLPLTKTATGWVLPYTVAAGNYQYKFIVDGKSVTDPLNPHQITTDGKTHSFLSIKPNRTFTLKGYNSANTIRLTGDFINWNEQGYTLEHRGNEWTISMRLKPGKYLYKFMVDGNWILDPGNRQWEQNEFGTGNSVLWIE